MRSGKPKFSINQIIQFNTLFFISVFAVTVGLSTVSMYKLQKEKVNEKLVLARMNIEENLGDEFLFIKKNLSLMKSYLSLLQPHSAKENLKRYFSLVQDTLHDRRVQYHGYVALEDTLARKYFNSDAIIVGSRRDLSLHDSSEYMNPTSFLHQVWHEDFYKTDPNQVWYHVARRSHHIEFTDVYFDKDYMKKWMVTAGLGIYDSSGNFSGMVGIDVLLDELAYQVEGVHIGKTGGAILVDTRSNRILTRITGARGDFIHVNDRYETPKFEGTRAGQWNELVNTARDVTYFKGDNGRRYLVSVASIPNVPWVILCYQEYYEAYQNVFWEISVIVLIGATGLLVLILVSFQFRKLVTDPLEYLIMSLGQNIKSARRNEVMKVEVTTASYREVEKVSRLVNTLVRVINSRTRRHIQTLEEQRSKAMHSARMASVGQMAGNVAHEINSPLTAISLHAEVLAKELEKKEDLDSVAFNRIRVIRQMTERIAKIVRGFLSISRDGAMDPQQKFALSEIVHETLVISQSRLNTNGVSLHVSPVPDVMLKCRAVQISQVLLNLLNNAHDAIQTLEERWIRIDFQESKDRLAISVMDSGNGISQSVSQKIMQPFFTTKDVSKGTGLGLSISKSIIEAHGGRLFYDSQCDHTRFVIDLPKA